MPTEAETLWYPWSRKSGPRTTWGRSGSQFEPAEHRLFRQASEWFAEFQRGSPTGELEGYVVPLARRPLGLGGAEVLLGKTLHAFGISPLRGGEPLSLVFVLGADETRPEDGQLVQIWQAKRLLVPLGSKGSAEHVAVVEGWVALEADAPYLQVDPRGTAIFDQLGIKGEPRSIERRVDELFGDAQLARMIGPAIVSSPTITELAGGITFGSHAARGAVAETVLESIQLMLPLPYRSLSPPQAALKGKQYDDGHGHVFHVADRPMESLHGVAAILGPDRAAILHGVTRRDRVPGEQSVTANWIVEGGDAASAYARVLADFNRFDITLAEDLGERTGGYVDPARVRDVLHDEDLPIEIVHARHRVPKQPSMIPLDIKDLRLDIEARLADAPASFRSDLLVGRLASAAFDAIQRTATSAARDACAPSVSDAHFRAARTVLLSSLEGVVSRTEVRSLAAKVEKDDRWQKDERYHVIKNSLIEAPADFLGLWERLGNSRLFPEPGALQSYVQKLREAGYIHVDRKKRFCWSA